MKIKNTYKVITNEGDTSDIIESVMMAYDIENDNQIADLAEQLKGTTQRETCRNIWAYLIDNVRYVADIGTQQIKSPARLLHDATGDCKSYSIFTACILRYLDIKHFFRFASYSNSKEATHVYIVAVINNKNVPIDAVAFVQARKEFGTEIKYNYRVDMNSRTTKIAYLAGIRPAKVGSTDVDVKAFLNSELFKVWLDNEDENSLTPAKGYLLSEWDKYWTLLTFETSKAEKLKHLNALQYVGAMIRFYNTYRHDRVMLEKAGFAFSNLIQDGRFDSNETDPQKRDFFSDAQQYDVLIYINDVRSGNRIFIENWQQNIIDANLQYNIAGIGSVTELRDDLKKTGGYYLYSYIPESEISKYNATVYRKRLVQNRILNLNKDILSESKRMTKGEVDNLIYSGCVTTWGSTPNLAIESIGKPKIGIDPVTLTLIFKLVVAAISVIMGIIALVNALKSVSKETISDGMPQDGDFSLSGSGGTGSNKPGSELMQSGTSFLIPLLLGGGLILSKFKN